MRPNSILIFEKLYLATLILGLINSVLNWGNASQILETDPNATQLGSGFLVLTIAGGFLISLLLWYLTARKASSVAKWIITVFFGLGVLALPMSLGSTPVLNIAISGIALIIQGYAVYLLFRPDAKQWFASKGKMADLEKTFE